MREGSPPFFPPGGTNHKSLTSCTIFCHRRIPDGPPRLYGHAPARVIITHTHTLQPTVLDTLILLLLCWLSWLDCMETSGVCLLLLTAAESVLMIELFLVSKVAHTEAHTHSEGGGGGGGGGREKRVGK